MRDEIWTTRDGRKIPVGEMTEDHVRNVLRMILHKRRIDARKVANGRTAREECERLLAVADEGWDGQDDGRYLRDLANPNIYFPLIDGGVYGSPALQSRFGK